MKCQNCQEPVEEGREIESPFCNKCLANPCKGCGNPKEVGRKFQSPFCNSCLHLVSNLINRFIGFIKYEIISRGNVTLAQRVTGGPKSERAKQLAIELSKEEQDMLAGNDYEKIQGIFNKYYQTDDDFVYLHQIRNQLRNSEVRDTGFRFDKVESEENNDFLQFAPGEELLFEDKKLSYIRRVYYCDLVLRKLNEDKHSWEQIKAVLAVCKRYDLYLRGRELKREQVVTNLLAYKLLKVAEGMPNIDVGLYREISDWAKKTVRPIEKEEKSPLYHNRVFVV